MSRAVIFRPQAEAEVLETRDWYESRQARLGSAFRKALDETIERIAENPLQFPRARGETRRATLERFPYAVYFRAVDDSVVVLAVHGHQHPRRWQSRS